MTHPLVSFALSQHAELYRMLGVPIPPNFPYEGAAFREAHIPKWLTPTLLRGEHAKARLTRWVAAGRPEVSAEDVRVVGDHHLDRVARRVLSELPPPLRHHLSLHVVVHVLGSGTAGHYAARRRPVAGAQEGEADLVAIWRPRAQRCPLRRWRIGQRVLRRFGFGWLPPPRDPERDFEGFLVHEVAHAFLEPSGALGAEPVTPDSIREGREDHERLLRLAHEWNLQAKLWEDPERAERWAAALTAELGYPDHVGGDCQYQQRAARERILAEAAAAAAKAPAAAGTPDVGR